MFKTSILDMSYKLIDSRILPLLLGANKWVSSTIGMCQWTKRCVSIVDAWNPCWSLYPWASFKIISLIVTVENSFEKKTTSYHWWFPFHIYTLAIFCHEGKTNCFFFMTKNSPCINTKWKPFYSACSTICCISLLLFLSIVSYLMTIDGSHDDWRNVCLWEMISSFPQSPWW